MFFFVYLSGNVEIRKLLFDVVTCEGLCISFDENEKEDLEVLFSILLISPFEQWGVDKWDIAQFTLASHTHTYIYIILIELVLFT